MDQPAWFFYETGKKVTATDLVRANHERMRVWQKMQDFHQTYDLLLTPVVLRTAFPRSVQNEADCRTGRRRPRMPFTQPFNLTGQPAASVPCGSMPTAFRSDFTLSAARTRIRLSCARAEHSSNPPMG